jgi:NitT/TauT family transport system substrate-binding protein
VKWKFLAAIAAAVASPVSAQNLEKITLGYAAAIGPQYSAIFYGEQLGFFADAGLDPEFIIFQGTPVVAAQVSNGSITFGAGAEPSLLLISASKGTPLDVRFVYNLMRSTVYNFAVTANSPIQSVADMKGKRIGVHSLASGNLPLTRSALRTAGIDPDSEITFVPVGTGPAAWKQLTDGNVDALNMWLSENAKMTAGGIDIRQIDLPELYRPIFTGSFLAKDTMIAENPDLIRRFGKALAQSTVACRANHEDCVRAFWNYDPTARPTAENEAEWVKNSLASLKSSEDSFYYFPDGRETWGSFTPGALDVYVKALHETGLIESTDFDANQIFTNAFAEAYSDFDPAEVVKRATAGN